MTDKQYNWICNRFAEIIGRLPAKEKADGPLDAAVCSPLRAAYSKEEMEAKLRDWMVKEFGHPRDYINDPDQRNAWYRDNGLLYHFICDHFPSESDDKVMGGESAPATPTTQL